MERGRLAARQARALRGGAAVAVATVTAATAHTLSGGGAPPFWLLVAVVVLATPLGIALVGRRPALWRIALAVAASQALLHATFAAVGPAAPAMAVGHDHGALLPALGPAVALADPAMLAGHALAGLVTTALLAYGERMLRALGRGMRRVLRRASARIPVIAWPEPVPAPLFRTRLPRVDLDSLSRRGPPALLGS